MTVAGSSNIEKVLHHAVAVQATVGVVAVPEAMKPKLVLAPALSAPL